MELTYSKTTPTTYSDPEIQAIVKGLRNMFKALRIGNYLVDTFPWLKYIPLGGVSELRQFHEEELSLFHSQLRTTREKMVRLSFDHR